MRKGSPGRRWATLVAVAALGTATACSTEDSAGALTPGDKAARPRPSVDAEAIAAAEKEALAAYAGYLEASQKAELASDPMHPELTKYLADPLLTWVRLTIREAKEHGAMRTGTLVSDPTVTSVSLDTVPATVTIQDCIDATKYRLIDVKSKKVVPGSASGRYLATATASRYPDGRWLINEGAVHQDQPC